MVAEHILAWAKEHHPEKYAETLKVARRPKTFARFLSRLVEIRFAEDPDWDPPLRVLEETSLRVRFRLPSGAEIEVAGRHAEGDRVWTFAELAQLYETGGDLGAALAVKQALDLVWDDGQPFAPPPEPEKREPEPTETEPETVFEQGEML